MPRLASIVVSAAAVVATAELGSAAASSAASSSSPFSPPKPAAPATCGIEKVVDHIYGTSHFETPKVADADACCAACAASDKCKAYTFEDDNGECFLKDNAVDGGAQSGRTSGRNPPPACSVEAGIEYLGNDVAAPATAADEGACCAACQGEARCLFFTFEGASKLCHLKNTDAPDNQRPNATCTSGYVGSSPPSPPSPNDVSVALAPVLRWTTSPHFVCWNIDASANRGFFWRNLSAATPDLYGAQLARQAAAIGHAQEAGFSLLRFGGSGNDYLTYAFNGTQCPPASAYKQCLNETHWRDLLSFTAAAEARMVFGLSMNTGEDYDRPSRHHDGGGGGAAAAAGPYPYPWDPSNARAILQWTIDAGLDHLIAAFELGNEQNSKYTADQTAADFAILHNLTVELWPDAARRPVLFGPDPHSLHGPSGSQLDWIADWLTQMQAGGVPVAGVTHHEYIEVDPSADGFTSASTLSLNGQVAAAVNATVRARAPDVQATGIYGGEVGPHNGGSPPCDHTSMRWAVFGDSLWYADALAAKARHGYAGLCRQDYIGADYGMVDCSTGAPLPDFYTALLWAKTMGARVLEATTTAGAAPGGPPLPAEKSTVRVYAHCTNRGDGGGDGGGGDGGGGGALAVAAAGSVTVLAINLGNRSTVVHFDVGGAGHGNGDGTVQAYVLEGTDAPGSSMTNGTGLLGTGVTLNGELLVLGAGGALPALVPATTTGVASAELPAHSVAFFVLPDAAHPACD